MKQSQLNCTFIDPNSPDEFEKALKTILLEKILAEAACAGTPPSTV